MVRVVLLVTLASLGCGSDVVAEDTALAIELGAVEGLDEVFLTIYGGATCAGNRATGGSPLAGFENLRLRENEGFAAAISVGRRIFAITGESATIPGLCAAACQEAEIIAGTSVTVVLDVVEVPCAE